jgi:methylase of polypeptide subunit release factors
MEFLYTSYTGDNSDLILAISSMYLKPGFRVADVTYGKGVFWRKVDLTQIELSASDIKTCAAKYDFKKLPYEDAVFDVVVFDPPYCHNPGQMIVNDNYQNAETTKGLYHNDIVDLYSAGMVEAFRILKPGGMLWVKCKDELESSYQRWSHIEIYDLARQMGFFGKDLFILTQKSRPIVQHKNQQHARKNHSYLWIFQKLAQRDLKQVMKMKIF